MRRTILAFTVLTIAGPASVQAESEAGPLDGRWAWDIEDCGLEPGASDSIPVVIADGEISYYESLCTIDSLTPIGQQEMAWTAQLTCAGEGETWDRKSILAIGRDPEGRPRQLIDIDLESGYVIARHYCE